jgi:hypothetical protein
MSSDRAGRVVSLGQVAGHAVDRLVQQRSAKRSNVPMVAPALPEMPEDLARQVAVLSGKATFGDFRMTVPIDANGREEVASHPLAAAYAEQERHKLDPASPERICRWLMMLAEMLGNRAPKLSDAVMQMTCRTLARDLPAVCWEENTLMTVLLTETHWPAIPRLKELLGPVADEVRRKADALDRIARADPAKPRFRSGPAREAKGYDPGPASPQHKKPQPTDAKAAAQEADAAEPIEVDPAAVRARLVAVFGEDAFATDLLANRLKERGQ